MINLLWRDIDFDAQTVRVSAKRAGTFAAGGDSYPIMAWSAKSYEERVVPVPESTVSLLARLQGESDGSPYVFVSLDRLARIATVLADKGELGANYEPVNNMKARFDLIQTKARAALAEERGVAVDDVPWERGTIHDLRRTYGTRMARVVPMHVLKEYMGHAKITTTQSFYLAAETQDAERAREALESMFETPAKGSDQGRTQGALSPN